MGWAVGRQRRLGASHFHTCATATAAGCSAAMVLEPFWGATVGEAGMVTVKGCENGTHPTSARSLLPAPPSAAAPEWPEHHRCQTAQIPNGVELSVAAVVAAG